MGAYNLDKAFTVDADGICFEDNQGNVLLTIAAGAADPTISGGTNAPVGSSYTQSDGTIWQKTGADDTDWTRLNIKKVKQITANHTVVALDDVILADPTSGDIDITLMPAGSANGKIVEIKLLATYSGNNKLRLLPNGAELIDGEVEMKFSKGSSLTVFSDGTGWNII